MKLVRTREPNPGLMQFVGVLDVVLLLLIFFLLGTQAVVQPGVAVSLPKSPFTLAAMERPMIVTITAQPGSAIYFQNEKLEAEQLRVQLGKYDPAERSIVLKADRTAPVEMVTTVSNICLEMGFSLALATSYEE